MGEMRNAYNILFGIKVRGHFEDLSADGMIILEC
jgi:hypothetical protein